MGMITTEDNGLQNLSQSISAPESHSHDSRATNTEGSSSRGSSPNANRSQITLDTGPRSRSFDAAMPDFEKMTLSPVVTEHEHGLGSSGLRRIRQQPPRSPIPASAVLRSSSLNLTIPTNTSQDRTVLTAPPSPSSSFAEDLTRFSAESLHSFSFSPQSEDSIFSRHNVLKRSIDFMRDKLGWAGINPGIASAQARLSGDTELQTMLELLSKAQLIGLDSHQPRGLGIAGPITGPAEPSAGNVFDKTFANQVESPTRFEPQGSGLNRLAALSRESVRAENAARAFAHERDPGEALDQSKDANAPDTLSPTSRVGLKRTLTDVAPLTLRDKLTDELARPYVVTDVPPANNMSASATLPMPSPRVHQMNLSHKAGAAPHGHGNRAGGPSTQAIFTTDNKRPWTITAANDLACLVFGVQRSELRKLGILEVVREERRGWLSEKLSRTEDVQPNGVSPNRDAGASKPPTSALAVGSGVTAKLLSKPPSRVTQAAKKSQAATASNATAGPAKANRHLPRGSRGVLLCGDVIPIEKRDGTLGSASLWVKEKRGGLIWVLEEIVEDVVYLDLDEVGCVMKGVGAVEAIWGSDRIRRGMDVKRLIPDLPKVRGTNTGALDFEKIVELQYFTAKNSSDVSIPIMVERISPNATFRVSSFPYISGIVVLSAADLTIRSSNAVFSAALFGRAHPFGSHICELIPGFDRILEFMAEEEGYELVDGMVIPEYSFRQARAAVAIRDRQPDVTESLLLSGGLPIRHRDGAEISVDVQMRVVKNTCSSPYFNSRDCDGPEASQHSSETVYALWITYSRQLHAAYRGTETAKLPPASRPGTPPRQPAPLDPVSPNSISSRLSTDGGDTQSTSLLTRRLRDAVSESITDGRRPLDATAARAANATSSPASEEKKKKKSIDDFTVIEDMGQGAYGQVKLCRDKHESSRKVVIKFVTKRRILVDTWTRDRRLGTVPLEIHVLDYLRRDGFKHPNIVEMVDFFEDDVNYYIEMTPHGLPGMDLFDYIELRVNMEEKECRKIFVQVAEALHHLHTVAKVVHRDVKDENVILDGEGNIKLIDFGSAAYIKNGPFDVFVGTIDYAAPEVLAGKSYRGKEQDVWALGILLYTIVYKENPFYSIDEIMDHDLRVPWIMNDDNIDLIRLMLNRDVDKRITIGQVLGHRWCLDGPDEADS